MKPISKIVVYKNCHFYTELIGKGPPVLFIQGVGVRGRGWMPQVEALASQFSCLIFDNRGMGQSQPTGTNITIPQLAEDCQAIMEAYGWKSAHIIGHSMGGAIALELALSQPQNILSLSLLCTMANGALTAPLSWRMITLGLGTMVGTKVMRRRSFVRLILPPGQWPDSHLDQLASSLEPLFGHDLAAQPPVANEQLKALRKFNSTPKLHELRKIPTLIVSAKYDPIAPPSLGKAISSGIPNSRFIELEDASHGVPLVEPNRINSILQEHLSGLVL